jgi:hypothetical protein
MPNDAQISAVRDTIFGMPSGSNPSGPDVDLEDFDLAAVFGRLQILKQQAEAIEDTEERRRFAERVALGFLAGISDDDDDDGGISRECDAR